MTTARLSRSAPSIDLADPPLGAIASRDGSTAPTEAPTASPAAGSDSPLRVGGTPSDELLWCRCGVQVKVVRLNAPPGLGLGHVTNLKSAHHYPRLARPRTP